MCGVYNCAVSTTLGVYNSVRSAGVVCESVGCACNEVGWLQILPLMRHMGRHIRRQGLGIPTDNLEPVKRMLSIGVLAHMKVPLPDCMTEDGLEPARVKTWSACTADRMRSKRKVRRTAVSCVVRTQHAPAGQSLSPVR